MNTKEDAHSLIGGSVSLASSYLSTSALTSELMAGL